MIALLVSFNSSSATTMRQCLCSKNMSKTKELHKLKPVISYLDINIDNVLSSDNKKIALILPK
jgi:hypothetical protein